MVATELLGAPLACTSAVQVQYECSADVFAPRALAGLSVCGLTSPSSLTQPSRSVVMGSGPGAGNLNTVVASAMAARGTVMLLGAHEERGGHGGRDAGGVRGGQSRSQRAGLTRGLNAARLDPANPDRRHKSMDKDS